MRHAHLHRPSRGRTPANFRTELALPIALGVLSFCTLAGCGYNARDAYLSQQQVVIAARPGDGSTIAAAPEAWPLGRRFASVRADEPIEPAP